MNPAERKFLAVSDETDECLAALIFAAMRAKAVNAGLVVLRCAPSPGLGGWIGLDRDISQDALDLARLKALRHIDAVEQRVGVRAELTVSPDDPVDAIARLIDEDRAIKSLVLAAAPGWRPGPLVSRLAKGKPIASRPVAVTVIPGEITDAELDALGGLAS